MPIISLVAINSKLAINEIAADVVTTAFLFIAGVPISGNSTPRMLVCAVNV